MKPRLLIPFFIGLFLWLGMPSPGNARTIILPFQVIPPEKKDHQWLGRAISYYLNRGMEFNSIETIPDNRIHSLLNSHSINFPYHISKATGIKLSVLAKADTIIWGEVLPSEEAESGKVQVRGYIIDLNRQTQKYLPLIKFNITDLYTFQSEMLTLILQYFQKTEVKIPELNLDHHGYETFIKSLLLTDPQKKISLLEGSYTRNSGSELINLELAKCYLALGNLEKAGLHLSVKPESDLLKFERLFLDALINVEQGKREQAEKTFSDLLVQKQYVSEASNNLGVLRFQEADFEQAARYFLGSLMENKDPEVFCNYIHSLIKSAQNDKVRATLNTALLLFPDDENLIKLFSYFVDRNPNRNRLVSVFRKYIPEMDTPVPDLPEAVIRIKNPFELQSCENLPLLTEIEKTLELHRRENRIEAIKNSERLLEINPFIPRLHRILAEIYRKQKNVKMAESYSLSSAYLEDQNSF